jgi:glycolate oxidase subunit GlcD
MGSNALVSDLTAALGKDAVRSGPLDRRLFSKDAGVARGEVVAITYPSSTDEAAEVVRIAARHDLPVVVRGAGTGLAGGAVPADPGVVLVTMRMNQIEVDEANWTAWVGPGVINLDLSAHTRPLGLHFAPDPSSQAACTIGGNVANNSGGPHCLSEGTTANHVLALEFIDSSGEIHVTGTAAPDQSGLDVRAILVGSEGTMAVVTRALVRLTPNPPAVKTMLFAYPDVLGAAGTVSDIIAAGVVPAALEMMDRGLIRAVENFVHADLPVDAAAVLLAEVDGHPAAIEAESDLIVGIARERGAFDVRVAADDAEREILWKARKSAFGAIAQVAPDYYLHDTVVPRTRLVEVLDRIYRIAEHHDLTVLNTIHAGDGNLHPKFAYDASDADEAARVKEAAGEIVALSIEMGGVLSGEHGIGLEKRDLMPLMFSEVDLGDASPRLPLLRLREGRSRGRLDMTSIKSLVARRFGKFTADVPGAPAAQFTFAPTTAEDCAAVLDLASEHGLAVLPWGGGTHQQIGNRVDADIVLSTSGFTDLDWRPDDLTAVVGSGVGVAEIEERLAERSQTAVLAERPGASTIGGAVASAASGWRRLRYGPTRDRILEVVVATGDGRVVRAGGQVVKNVSGYDIPRLMCGSLGSLGVITRLCLKLWPIGATTATVRVDDAAQAMRVAFRPLAVLDSPAGARVYLAGTAAEIEAQAEALGGAAAAGLHWPEIPSGETLVAVRVPRAVTSEAAAWVAPLGDWVSAHGVGEVLASVDGADAELLNGIRARAESIGGSLAVLRGDPGIDPWGAAPATLDLQRRIKGAFDPLSVMVPGKLPGGL